VFNRKKVNYQPQKIRKGTKREALLSKMINSENDLVVIIIQFADRQ